MVSDKNGRYSANDLSCAPNEPQSEKRTHWFNEGDVARDSNMTVEAAIGSALICFFTCYCTKRGRFSPADMRRRGFDPKAMLWSLAPKMRCRTCNRVGGIVRITRVRVSGAKPEEL